ncbi:isoprenyl transferase [Erysipelothrix inopinata]|uniref:Isoprenyl transferase n=1 Tax=Erysipelothrix inopinata TaxID=225084 RepID=A0A7G9RYQ7_9FIRM|nr:isoprenyl transferase [Erysipelothrix inopinata]QNN60732.1 isoprenyl transferase [Erysipelothrix inopinata]
MESCKHVAIIMDGNGRWAKKQKKTRSFGHYYGSENVREIALRALDMGVEVITLYAFSTENWKRPQEEIDYLMKLPAIFFEKFLKELMERGIRIETIGDLTKIPERTRKVMENAVERTKNNDKLVLNFALNYGARDEIVRAVNRIADSGISNITERDFSLYLDTKDLPDVDLLIRTGGEQRLSNYLLWQLAYAELMFVDLPWPEFGPDEFEACLVDFDSRNRRFGGL